MDWVLFLQIEVIMLTIGLVLAFVISFRQTAKDNSFFRRTSAVAQALSEWGKEQSEKQSIEKAKMFEKFLESMKKDNKEEKK